mgnify:CR=1 FL=1
MAKKKDIALAPSESAPMAKKRVVLNKKETNTISIWSILESEDFAKAFRVRIAELKEKREEASREAAYEHCKLKRIPLDSVFEKFALDEDGIVLEFVKIMAKKSDLSSGEREAVQWLVSPVINTIAKDWTNKLFDEKAPKAEKPKAKKDPSKKKVTNKKKTEA